MSLVVLGTSDTCFPKKEKRARDEEEKLQLPKRLDSEGPSGLKIKKRGKRYWVFLIR